MKLLKILGVLILLLLIGGTVTAGVSGLVPGLSSVFGANKPKDLGITYTQADFDGGMAKTKVVLESLPANTPVSESDQFSGSHPVEASFTPAELTAGANSIPYKHLPFKSVQIKINPDGTAEASGIIVVDKIMPWVTAMGFSEGQVQEGLQKLNLPKNEIVFYVKGTGEVVNNTLSGNAEKLVIGRIPVPANLLNQYQPALWGFAQDRIDRIDGLNAESAKFQDGQLYFKGTLPDTRRSVTE